MSLPEPFKKLFADLLPSKKAPAATPDKEPDFDLAFRVWAEKQKFWQRLTGGDGARLQITKGQLLSLMGEAYKAGYKRAA